MTERPTGTVKCLRQFIRPSGNIDIEGVGDCRVCVTHEDNKKCKMYVPITVQYYEVKDD